MRRMKMIFSYDGSGFSGYQRLPDKRTVQGTIEHTIRKVDIEPIRIVASGRTDAKVHALAQCAHFDVIRDNIRAENFQHIFNRQLPKDIQVLHVEEIDSDFHARFDVVTKEYWYKIKLINDDTYSPFTTRYFNFVKEAIDLERFNAIAKTFVGVHDYTAFCCMPEAYNCMREILYCYCEYDTIDRSYIIKIRGTGFMQYMVRIIIGFIFEVYNGHEERTKISELFETQDRIYVNSKMPAEGLYLKEVFYE